MDPDPIIVQYGAIKIGLSDDFPIIDKLRVFIKPIDRFGNLYPLDPAFVALAGITEDIVAEKGVGLKSALNSLDEFSEGSSFWSWGKDEFNTIA
ncbi:MAG: exonuclease, partial [Rhizobiaceae bacterium]